MSEAAKETTIQGERREGEQNIIESNIVNILQKSAEETSLRLPTGVPCGRTPSWAEQSVASGEASELKKKKKADNKNSNR